MEIFNPYILIIMGIMFEILGAFLLSLDSFGENRVNGILHFMISFSNWAQKSSLNMFIITLPITLILIVGIFTNSKIIVGLTFPLILVNLSYVLIIDNSKKIKNLLIEKKNERKINPIGFVLLLIGNILQLISVVWQMK